MDASLLLKYPYVKKQLGTPVKPEDILDRSYRSMYQDNPPPVFEPETKSIFPPAVGGPSKGGGSWRNSGHAFGMGGYKPSFGGAGSTFNPEAAAQWKAAQDAKSQKFQADQKAQRELEAKKAPPPGAKRR